MRKNLPITQKEHKIQQGDILVSRTDLKGHITYANQAFCALAQFTFAELKGQAHNLVRHPDMPSAAFQDLWDTIEQGKPWTGVVKNRCKNGDYYWVLATVSPEYDHKGNISGYLSVRTTPTHTQISQASNLYSRINAGHAKLPSALSAPWYKKISLRATMLSTCILSITTILGLSILLAQHLPQPITAATDPLMLTVATTGLLSLLLFIFMMHKTFTPLKDAVDHIQRMVEGQYGNMPKKFAHDELGDIADDMKTLQSMMQFEIFEGKAIVLAQTQQQQQTEKEKTATQTALANNFETNVGSLVKALADETQQVQRESNEMDVIAKALITQSEKALSSVNMGSSNVNSTAAAIEEMSVSVANVANQITDSLHISEQAVTQAAAATNMMEKLTDVSTEVSSIVNTISEIAEQTNLLALNASIEAARAGDAGRGFAVVAGEVKELANQTAQATDKIRTQIDSIQHESGQASSAIATIATTINNINDYSTAIATAMSEQAKASHEISTAAQKADSSIIDARCSVEELSASASEVDKGSDEMIVVSDNMKQRTEDVQQGIQQFVENLRHDKT
ncbi:MAG: PAS domain-containing methyl-accepting chemotaxis protein [Mariprofundus sp.]|nr:PAS domain-containing methyl-accepting chemotaxis protein [Mariprofundus sp.]